MPKRRQIICDAYNECGGDHGEFLRLVRHKGRQAGFNPLLIIALIQIAIKLWEIWLAHGVTTAPPQPLDGEPDVD